MKRPVLVPATGLWLLIGFAALPLAAPGRAPKAALPIVTAAAVPLYPRVAHLTNTQGIVRVSVATDGHAITTTSVENKDADPTLARAAQENLRTWQFATHQPTSFIVTFQYRTLDSLTGQYNPTVILRFPTNVQVDTFPWPSSSNAPIIEGTWPKP